MKVEVSDGALLEVDVVGSGPTVVFAHGWTNSMAVWAPVGGLLLQRGFRVVRYNQRGHGLSTLGSDAPSIARLGADMAELFEELDLRDAIVAGHSMGGMSALAFASEHPDAFASRVSSLFLVATAAAGIGSSPLARFGPRVVGSRRVDRALGTARGHALVRGAFGRSARPGAVLATRDMFLGTPAGVRIDYLRAILAMDLADGCRSIPVPTTIVVGSRDGLTPPALSRRLAESIPGSHLIELKGAGHMLPYEATGVLADLIGGTPS